MTLFELTKEQAELEAELEESGGELTPEIEERLAVTAESLPRKVDGYGALIHKFEGMASVCDAEIKRLTALKKVAQNSAKNLKNSVKDSMVQFGYQRLEGQTTKFFLRKISSLNVEEELLLKPYTPFIEQLQKKLPDYLSVSIDISKTMLKAAAKDSDVLPAGCWMVEDNSLTIK